MKGKVLSAILVTLVIIPAFATVALGQNNNGSFGVSIEASETGKIGEEYKFSVCCKNPNVEMIYYRINWGGGYMASNSWIGPFNADESTTFTHTYLTPTGKPCAGTFTITVESKDEQDNRGNAYEFQVTIESGEATISNTLCDNKINLLKQTNQQKNYKHNNNKH
jgi:hypothetical protein